MQVQAISLPPPPPIGTPYAGAVVALLPPPPPIGRPSAPPPVQVVACPVSNVFTISPPTHVAILEAKQLLAMDSGGTSDPYVRVSLGGRVLYKTKVEPKTLTPHWNDDLFVVTEPGELRFEVMDHDFLRDDFIGDFKITLPYSGEPLSEWFPIKTAKGAPAGQMHIVFHK